MNKSKCVFISPDEYQKRTEEANDTRLFNIANERMQNFNSEELISAEDLYKEFGITEEMIGTVAEVEFE